MQPATPIAATAKRSLRTKMAQRRQALSPEDHAALSLAAQKSLLADPAWQAARDVLCYCAVRGEMDTSLLLQAAWRQQKRLLLPRCRPDIPGEMALACVTCAEDLVPGAYQIPEPHPDRCPEIDQPPGACGPALAILPGLAFDRRGNRLGYGGGYYDRLLSPQNVCGAASQRPKWIIGLCYSFQLVDSLPTEPWDMPMHAIITDSEVLWLSS